MLGLIKKDLFIAKRNLKTLVLILLIFFLMAIDGNSSFSFLPGFISVMVMMSTFSYEEYNHTDAYVETFPNGKKNAVRAKYLSTLFIIFLSLLFTFLLSFLVSSFQNKLDLQEIIYTTFGCGAGVLVLQSILYPLIYKFGIEKSRIVVFVLVFGLGGFFAFLSKLGLVISPDLVSFFERYFIIVIPIFLFFVVFLSYKIAEHIYLRKEF